jgi:hypothetical protein
LLPPTALGYAEAMLPLALAIALSCLVGAAPGAALEPGTGEAADLLLPGTAEAVRRGMRIEVVAPRPVRWRRAYVEATEKHASQVRLGDAGDLLNYVAGLPFPSLDPVDPRVAVKIMWNYAFGPWISDDASSWSLEWQLGTLQPGKPMKVETQQRSDAEHSRWLNLVGRTAVPPLPALPDNPENAFRMEVYGPTLPVFHTMLRSGPMLTVRYLAVREDDVWYYTSFDRKVRRLSPSVRYDATGGVVTDLNSAWGFSAPIGSYTWRFLGERPMLAILHGRRYPVEWCPEGGDFAPCEAWEKRTVYVVEGTAEKPYDIYSKRIIAIDKQAWVVVASDLFDKKGALWKTIVNVWSYRPDARGGPESEERPYLLGGTCVDLVENRANRWRLPGTRTLAEAVAIDTGLTRERFSVSALPQAFE